MNQDVKFFFFLKTSGNTTQTLAHVTSIVTILFAVDLLFDYNPVKTAFRQFVGPINLGGSSEEETA